MNEAQEKSGMGEEKPLRLFKTVDEIHQVFKTQKPDNPENKDAVALYEESQKLVKEFQENETEFLAKHFKPEGSEDEGAEVKKRDPDEEIEIPAFKIKRSELGNYAKDRDGKEAIIEMVKGVREKDRTIKSDREERIPKLQTDLENATKELDIIKAREVEAAKQIDELKKKAGSSGADTHVSDFQVPEFTEEDFLTEEGQKKIKDTLVSINKIAGSSKAETTAMRAEIEELKKSLTKTASDVSSVAAEKKFETQVVKEYGEIDGLIGKYREEGLFKTERPVGEIETEYQESLAKIGAMAGCKGPLTDPKTGRYSKEYLDAVNLYMSDDGAELRSKCDAEKIGLPEDVDDLFRVYEIRTIRKNIGEDKIDYNRAIAIYKVEHPELEKQAKIKEHVKSREHFERAVNNRGKFAKEVSLTEGEDTTITLTQAHAILKILPKNRTKEQTEDVKQFLKLKSDLGEERINDMLAIK